jgi:U3 small nucleolar RNA-associated protein 6
VKRLRVKAPTHAGQRRVFFVLDRATRKFPGDIALWMQQIEYARRQKADKKLSQILTKALRLHPTKVELWTYAAQFAMEEHGDMTEARSYLQRGLRFCKGSKSLWLEYMKLELLYIAKIAARRQILGLDERPEPREPQIPMQDSEAGMVDLQPERAEDIRLGGNSTDDIVDISLENLPNTSTATGAIPIAIFDAAMIQFKNDDGVAQAFFDTVQEVDLIPCLRKILTHIAGHMTEARPESWRAVVCNMKVACVGTDISSPEFPKSFRSSLRSLQDASPVVRKCRDLVDAIGTWLGTFLKNDSLDVALRQIMLSTLRQLRTLTDLSHSGLER